MIIRLFLSCIVFSCFAMVAQAQGDKGISKLQDYLRGRVWAKDWRCDIDSCYKVEESDLYYWAGKAFFKGVAYDTTYDTSSFCFVIRHVLNVYNPAVGKIVRTVSACNPDLCIISVPDTGLYYIRYVGEAGTYNMVLRILSDTSFQFEGTPLPFDMLTERYIVVEPPEDFKN